MTAPPKNTEKSEAVVSALPGPDMLTGDGRPNPGAVLQLGESEDPGSGTASDGLGEAYCVPIHAENARRIPGKEKRSKER